MMAWRVGVKRGSREQTSLAGWRFHSVNICLTAYTSVVILRIISKETRLTIICQYWKMDNRGNKVSKNILFKKSGDRKPSLGSNLNKAIMTSR